MTARNFLKLLMSGMVGVGSMSLLSGCISRISEQAKDKAQGEPYRCGKCGYLTRSETDISGDRCPRCRARKLAKISEEEMAEALQQ